MPLMILKQGVGELKQAIVIQKLQEKKMFMIGLIFITMLAVA
jgi:hypothetical protein